MSEEKPSAALVIQKAALYINDLRKRNEELENDNEKLRNVIIKLGGRPPTPTLPSTQLGPPFSMHPPPLPRAPTLGSAAGANSIGSRVSGTSLMSNSIGSLAGFEGINIENLLQNPALNGQFVSSSTGVLQGMITADEFEKAKLENIHSLDHSLRNVPEPRNTSLDILSQENLHAAASAAAITQGWKYGNGRKMSFGLGPLGEGFTDGYLRKRRSVVDADFEDVRRGFYQGRRNSTIMTLEQMQEISKQQPMVFFLFCN